MQGSTVSLILKYIITDLKPNFYPFSKRKSCVFQLRLRGGRTATWTLSPFLEEKEALQY